jgi:hypothetical protein
MIVYHIVQLGRAAVAPSAHRTTGTMRTSRTIFARETLATKDLRGDAVDISEFASFLRITSTTCS